jgi:hypothetical protein
MRGDISDSDMELIYRQLANFLLQLFQLGFDRIGSLPSPEAEAQSPTSIRPLTFKAHAILQNGGVDTFGTGCCFYFPSPLMLESSALLIGLYDAKNKYLAFKVLKSLIPNLVNAKYDRCKLKLICDDFGLANLIVRSREDLTVVGVVDLE